MSPHFAGTVGIGSYRRMYLECSGAGSPTVVLISGKGVGAIQWRMVLAPGDPVHDADYDALSDVKCEIGESGQGVFPMVARFTRVCAYDRPDVRLEGPDQSTSVAQPHPVDHAADDLHRLLAAADEPGPYVLVPHSYGGAIATLFARTWPTEVVGLVMVDAFTPLLRKVASQEALVTYNNLHSKSVPEAPEAIMLLDALAKLDAAAPLRKLPAVVLAGDKPWRKPSDAKDPDPDPVTGVTFAKWQASEKLLAESLGAKLITKTNSGHNIMVYSPQLVIDAIREVVDAVRNGKASVTP